MTVSGVLVALSLGLVATESSADKNFTLRMEEVSRKMWEADFNKLTARPFEKLSCKPDARMTMPFAEGCVDAGDESICCDSWKIWMKCSDDGKWTQGDIDGESCKTTPRPKR
jgi:hypothetical protein